MPFVLWPWQFFFVILVGWVHCEQKKIMELNHSQYGFNGSS